MPPIGCAIDVTERVLLAASALVSFIVNTIGVTRDRRVPNRILVVKLDHLGDVITALPAVRALRDAHPSARIDLLVSPAVAPILAETHAVDEVLTYSSPRYLRHSAASDSGRALRDVARRRYDTIVELRGDSKTLVLPLWVRAGRRLDRGSLRVRSWFQGRVNVGRSQLHEVETNFQIVAPLLPAGARGRQPPELRLAVTTATKSSMRAKLEASGAARTWIAIQPGAPWRPRAWPADRFAVIARWVRDRYDASVAVLGSGDEKDIEASLRAALGSDDREIHCHFGTFTLPEVAALLSECRLFIGNDSGLAHLAAACGARVVVLFGPENPDRFRPWSQHVRVLHHVVPCWPCTQRVCVRPENPCVRLIQTAEVEAAVREILLEPTRGMHR